MLFKINRDVPANTAATALDWQKLKVAKGTIIEWLLHMPSEAADLMQVKVEYHGVQILPFSRNTYIYGIFEPTVIRENILVDVPPYELDIYAFNTDDSYSHEYNVYVNIQPAKPISVTAAGFDFKAAWSKIFGGGS